jgi:hypothetical protein
MGIVVVHHHRVDTQLDNLGPDDPQAPEEKGLQADAGTKTPASRQRP